jgi:hypothetical protein
MAISKSAVRTIYHVEDGPQSMYEIDARHALRFKDQWSETPFAQDGKPAAPVIEISSEWQDLKPSERIALAMKFGHERKGMTAAKADEVIFAEVERRLANPEPEPTLQPKSGRGQVSIPDDWRARNEGDRINMAVSLGAQRNGLTPTSADSSIQAELDRRASAPTPKPVPMQPAPPYSPPLKPLPQS